MSAVHLPASPRSPSLGLLGPDHGRPIRLVGPGAEAASQEFALLSLCASGAGLPLSGPCPPGGLVLLPSSPQGLAPLWPVHPQSLSLSSPCTLGALTLSVPCIPAVLVLRAQALEAPRPSFPPPLGSRGQKARPPVLSFSVSPQILRVIFTKCTRP